MNYRIIICAYSGIFDVAPSDGDKIDRATLDFVYTAIQRLSILLSESNWSGSVLVVTDQPQIAQHMERRGYRATLVANTPTKREGEVPDVGELLHAAALSALQQASWVDSDAVITVDPTLMLMGSKRLLSAHAILTQEQAHWVSLASVDPSAVTYAAREWITDSPIISEGQLLDYSPNHQNQRTLAGACQHPYGFYATTVGNLRGSISHATSDQTRPVSSDPGEKGILLQLDRSENYRITTSQEAMKLSRGIIEYHRLATTKLIDGDALSRQIHATGMSASGIRLLIFDFDGVMTDNRVLVMQDGTEGAVCNRSDGLGVTMLKDESQKNGWNLSMMVMSKERNPVVGKRCEKLKLECRQGIDDKLSELHRVCQDRGISLEQVAYVGNDINDLACMRVVGLPIAVGDAYPPILAVAKGVTTKPGGHGAVREVCDWFITSLRGR